MAEERFTDEEKCLMEISKTRKAKNVTFADENMMKNTGIPYFQKMISEYSEKHPEDKTTAQITIDYDSVANDSKGILHNLITEMAQMNGDWNRLTEKLNLTEQVVMAVATGRDYFNNNLTGSSRKDFQDCVQTYDALNISPFIREDIQQIMANDDLPFFFSDESKLIARSDDWNPDRPAWSDDWSPDRPNNNNVTEQKFYSDTGIKSTNETAKTKTQKPVLDDQTGRLIDGYRNSEQSIGMTESEIAAARGFGDDVTALFDCGVYGAKEGYRALLEYQAKHPEEVACMSFNDNIGLRADKEWTDNGVSEYISAMYKYLDAGEKLFSDDKFMSWRKCCNEQMNNDTYGCNLSNAIEIATALNDGKEFDEVARKLNQLDFADGSKDDVMAIVTEFASNGQDFADYLQQSGKGTKGRGNEDIVKDTPEDGKDDHTPGDN